ncbi:MAG: AI-2E family transporter [Halanaeroarchaeum sp.]
MSSPWEMDRARIGWWAIGGILAALVTWVVYSFVGTFVFGVFIYYATRPIYRQIKRYVKPASLAVAVSLLLITLPAVLLLAYTIAIGLQEFDRFVENRDVDIGQFEAYLEPYVDISTLVADPFSIIDQQFALDGIWRNVGEASAYVGFFGIAALHLFVIVILAFYLLRDDHRLAAWFKRRFSDGDGVVEQFVRRVDRDYSNIFFGNILNAFLTGVIGAISYGALDLTSPSGIGIPYPTLLGLLTGVASLIPVVGIKLVYFPLAGYLLYGSFGSPELLWFPIVFVVVSFVIVDVIPDLVLRPYVSGRNLHLGMVMLAYIFGPLLWGWYGLFLGPMLLVLVVHFTALVLLELVAGTEIESTALEDPTSDDAGPADEPPPDEKAS